MDPNASSTPTGLAIHVSIPQIIQLPSLDDSFGALFIGMCFCILCVFPSVHVLPFSADGAVLRNYRLYGLTLHQTYRYFRLYPQDLKWLKYMVCLASGISLPVCESC